MSAGENTVLVLEPEGLSNITFDMTVTTGAASGYVVDCASLRLAEGDRLEVEYSEGSKIDGGRVANARGPLVAVTFDVIVSDDNRATMIGYADALIAAATNPSGGNLRFRPDGVSSRSTYYPYLQSLAPSLAQLPGNRWDAPPSDGIYRTILSVSLMTRPFPTSDPSSPSQVLSATTIRNTDDGTRDNYVTIPSASIIGSRDALARLVAHPLTSEIGRLIIARRTSGLDNFQAVYYTSTARPPSAGWTTVSDASRVGGNYYTCQPVANDVEYGRRYTIANWEDHQGTAAIIVGYKAHGEGSADDWTIKAAWSIANTPLEGEAKAIESLKEWRILVLAEFDIPETEMSTDEALDLYIDVYVTRTAGIGTISVDFIQLMYTDECILDLSAPADAGASTSHNIQVDNLEDIEIAHIINQADNKLQYIMNAVGTPGMITLDPNVINRLDVLWERSSTSYTDDFSDYGGYWAKIADFEPDEAWDVSTAYSLFCAVVWASAHGSIGHFPSGYTVDIVNGSLDTATLVSGGKMRADGNDLRTLCNGVEIGRQIVGMNTASTKVWCNIPEFRSAVSLTINGAINVAGTVNSIAFNEPINNLPATGYGRIIKIENELYQYTIKNDATKTISGVTRAAFNTSRAGHNNGTTAYWIQNEITIAYGDANAQPPTASIATLSIDTSASTNASWRYSVFSAWDTYLSWPYPSRIYGTTKTPFSYEGSLAILGINIAGEHNGRASIANPCGISNVNITGGLRYTQYATLSRFNGQIQSKAFGATSWATEYAITDPTVQYTWQAWNRSEVVSSAEYVALYLQNDYDPAGGEDSYIEMATAILTLAAPPTITVGSEITDDLTSYCVEGSQCQPVITTPTVIGQINMDAPSPWPFPDTAFLTFYHHITTAASSTAQAIRVRLKVDESNYYQYTINKSQAESTDVDYYEAILLSDFSETGSPTLATVETVELYCTTNAGSYTIYVDDVRLVAADPGDAATYNGTGTVWDLDSGTWHVYELDSVAKALGQIEIGAGVEKTALLHTDYGNDIKFYAKCRAKRDDGKVGLVFRASDGTAGSEDLYAFLIDTANNQALLYDYAAGTPTTLGTSTFTCDKNTDYYLGVSVRGTIIECNASADLATLWNSENEMFDTTDGTHTSGQVGFMTIGTLGRFTDMRIDGVGDRHVPSDQLSLAVWSVFRTIAPFSA